MLNPTTGTLNKHILGPPTRCPFLPIFFGEGSPTKIDYRNKSGTLILTSLLEDLVLLNPTTGTLNKHILGPPTRCPFLPIFFGEGSPTKIDYRNKSGTLILTSLLEDLVLLNPTTGTLNKHILGPPTRCPFLPIFFGEGSPTKIDYRNKSGTLILTSLLEDLVLLNPTQGTLNRHILGPPTRCPFLPLFLGRVPLLK